MRRPNPLKWRSFVDFREVVGYRLLSADELSLLRQAKSRTTRAAYFNGVGALLAGYAAFAIALRATPLEAPMAAFLGVGAIIMAIFGVMCAYRSAQMSDDLDQGWAVELPRGHIVTLNANVFMYKNGLVDTPLFLSRECTFRPPARLPELPKDVQKSSRKLTSVEAMDVRAAAMRKRARWRRAGLALVEIGVLLGIVAYRFTPYWPVYALVPAVLALLCWMESLISAKIEADAQAGTVLVFVSRHQTLEALPLSKLVISRNGIPAPFMESWRPPAGGFSHPDERLDLGEEEEVRA